MRSASSPRAVNISTGTSDVRRICLSASKPSRRGSMTSRMTTSQDLAQRAFDSVRATMRRADFVAHWLEIIPDQTAQLAVVIDDEHARFALRRRRAAVQFIV